MSGTRSTRDERRFDDAEPALRSRLPPPNGHAWKDARADLIRRSIAWLAASSRDSLKMLDALDSLLGPHDDIKQRRAALLDLATWAGSQAISVGFTLDDIPRSPHGTGPAPLDYRWARAKRSKL